MTHASERRTTVDKPHSAGQRNDVQGKIRELVVLMADEDKMENDSKIERAISRLEATYCDTMNETPKAD